MSDTRTMKLLCALTALARSAVTGETPDRGVLEDIDLQELYALAQRHTLLGAVSAGLELAGIRDNGFREAGAKALRKVLSLETDQTALLKQLDALGIWYMPLKGAVLKYDYPRLGLREMSDCDILYDETHASDVRRILLEMGYTVDEYNMHNVDSYEKPPVCRFEMHRKLFSPYLDDRLFEYYKDVKQRLIKDEGNHSGWHFSSEDFYVYLLAHEYKHYMTGGSGLRFLLDTWVYLRKHGSELNREKVEKELDALGLRDFEQKNRALATALFEGKDLNGQQESLLRYMLDAGTFGTVDNEVRHQVEQLGGGWKGRLLFVKRRILIPMKTMESAYPFFYRHRALIPALYGYRLWKGLFRSRKKIAAELRALLHREP